MKKTSIELQPSYELKSHSGTLATAVLLVFGVLVGAIGLFLVVHGSSFSTEMSPIEVIAGGVILVGGVMVLPLLLRSNWQKTLDESVEFVDSISDLVKSWAVLHLGAMASQTCCELLDGYYLELTVRARNLNAPSFAVYSFLSPTQIVRHKPLLDMGAPKKHIFPLTIVPLDVDGFQKWKGQKEKWKSMIAEDDELREQILTNSLRYFMIEHHKLQGILSIDASGYEKYLMHPQFAGQYLYGKALGVRIIFCRSKSSVKKASAGFEASQIANAQLVQVGKRILEDITKEIALEHN